MLDKLYAIAASRHLRLLQRARLSNCRGTRSDSEGTSSLVSVLADSPDCRWLRRVPHSLQSKPWGNCGREVKLINIVLLPVQRRIGLDDDALARGLLEFFD